MFLLEANPLSEWIYMRNLKKIVTVASKVVAVVFLTAGNGWAVASYAKKYGMGCKSCHGFGSELNNLGLTFKKNGHSFGEKSAEPKEKSKQSVPRDDKVAGPSANSSDKPGSLPRGDTDGSSAVDDLDDAEQPVPETKVYSWKSSDGTPHFSDTPYVSPQGETKSVSEKVRKKKFRSGARPLSAIVPKRLQRSATKTTAPEPEKPVTANHDVTEPLETPDIEVMPVAQPKSYEECMEKIFITYPTPKTPDDAMEQFRVAESSCASFDKKPRR